MLFFVLQKLYKLIQTKCSGVNLSNPSYPPVYSDFRTTRKKGWTGPGSNSYRGIEVVIHRTLSSVAKRRFRAERKCSRRSRSSKSSKSSPRVKVVSIPVVNNPQNPRRASRSFSVPAVPVTVHDSGPRSSNHGDSSCAFLRRLLSGSRKLGGAGHGGSPVMRCLLETVRRDLQASCCRRNGL